VLASFDKLTIGEPMKSDQNGLIIGMRAPAFSAESSLGPQLQLADFLGKEVIVLFYPKDNTPVCTKELCQFQDAYASLQAKSVEVLGIGKGDLNSHRNFSNKFQFSFPLLFDEDGKIAKSYGVFHESWWRKALGLERERATFLIDHKGFVRRIWRNVKTKGHVEEVKYALDLMREFREDSISLPQAVLPRCAQ